MKKLTKKMGLVMQAKRKQVLMQAMKDFGLRYRHLKVLKMHQQTKKDKCIYLNVKLNY